MYMNLDVPEMIYRLLIVLAVLSLRISLEEEGMEICEGGIKSVEPTVLDAGLAVVEIVDNVVVVLGLFTTRYR